MWQAVRERPGAVRSDLAKVTICLPVLNGVDFVEEALQSIAEQTCPDIHVLASNNASTDRTGEILERWSDQLAMTVLHQPETVPMQQHFNLLLDAVRTDYLMVLCHDDYLAAPDAIELAVGIAEEHPDVSAIYCDLAYVSRRRRILAQRRFGREGRFEADPVGRNSLRTARNLFGIPLLMRRSVLAGARYDPQFHYLMDVDLSWTLSRARPAWHLPRVLIANRYRRQNATWTLLSGATEEYARLAAKYRIDMTPADRTRLAVTNWIVARKKQVFGLYERLVTAIG